jgi:hypothetical protein
MRIPLLLPLAALLAAAPAAAQPTQTYESDAGYVMEVPAAWQRMPESDLAGVRREVGRFGMALTIEAGYRVGASGVPFTAVGRMDLDDPITLEEFGAAFLAAGAQEAMQDALDQTPAAQAGGRVAAPVWDAPNGVVWTRVALETHAPAFSWSVATLHPDGRAMIICIYYGSKGEDELRVRNDLLAIIRSLRTD